MSEARLRPTRWGRAEQRLLVAMFMHERAPAPHPLSCDRLPDYSPLVTS